MRYRAIAEALVATLSDGAVLLNLQTKRYFSLNETGYTWPVRGEWRGSSFTIRYPDPADGPDIVETYVRR